MQNNHNFKKDISICNYGKKLEHYKSQQLFQISNCKIFVKSISKSILSKQYQQKIQKKYLFSLILCLKKQQNSIIFYIIFYMQNHSEKLSIVFLTDYHHQTDYLSSLEKWYIQYTNSHNPVNYIFVGGDSMNIDNLQSTPLQQEKSQKQLFAYFDKLKQIFNCQLIHIPGNHDPEILFTPQKISRIKETNIHNKVIKIGSGLEIIGFGGSGPAFVGEDKQWDGYPFNADEELEKAFTKATQLLSQQQNAQKQLILLTHVGPQQSSTTHDRRKKQKHISAGSKFLNKLFERKQLLLWVHGHIHNGGNIDRINGVPVINPGPLVYGRFCILELEKCKVQGKWILNTINIQQLRL